MLQFCNRHNSTVWVAIIYHRPNCPDGGNWAKKGWWRLDPVQCKIVIGTNLPNRYYYFFEEAANGAYWTGAVRTQAPRRVFDWCRGTGSTDSRELGFRRIDTDGASNYTVNLTS